VPADICTIIWALSTSPVAAASCVSAGAVTLRPRMSWPVQPEAVGDHLVERIPAQIRGHHPHGRLVRGRLLATDPEHRDIPHADA
jgi:hypothetical protein